MTLKIYLLIPEEAKAKAYFKNILMKGHTVETFFA